MSEQVFVTGMGMVGPCGNSTKAFWEGLLDPSTTYITALESDLSQDLLVKAGGQVKGIEAEKLFSKRLLRKCSRFSVLSLLSSMEAVQDAGLELEHLDKDRIGIFVGNNSGGWESAREGLEVLHREGPKFVSPYLASNWFPAAAQGHLSLVLGTKGFSKTVIADRASGLLAIAYAAKAIRSGAVDMAIAGGVETPLDDWALAFYKQSGILCSTDSDEEAVYKPFDRNRNGLLLAEGAAFVVLESQASVKRRKAEHHIVASVQGFGMTNSGGASDHQVKVGQYARAIRTAIRHSDVKEEDIAYLSLDGAANEADDTIECEAIHNVFADRATQIPSSCPKSAFGNSIGASGAIDFALAVQTMRDSIIPPVANLVEPDERCPLRFVQHENLESRVRSSLVLSRGLGGVSAAMVLKQEI
ncbi:beta-ketoacyl-[acyl-carrier-protein] synthase family protein [Gorillibacterium sp. CAU 1737]|uniref:beta-ketoacyl-[acyl-carrier-protein] synthase family protein n=1 Tax=Gorillibacterium sp. CAU 1737 TaxID=3140362 RepID=UPI00326186EB